MSYLLDVPSYTNEVLSDNLQLQISYINHSFFIDLK